MLNGLVSWKNLCLKRTSDVDSVLVVVILWRNLIRFYFGPNLGILNSSTEPTDHAPLSPLVGHSVFSGYHFFSSGTDERSLVREIV
jgi:hypothetical protein